MLVCPILAALLLASAPACWGQSLAARLNRDGFPLAVGNRWEYAALATYATQSLDPPGPLDQVSWQVEVAWEVVARESVLGEEAYRLDITHRTVSGPDSGQVATGQSWFAMRGDTLFGTASRGTGGLDPVVAQLFKPVSDPDPPYPWGVASLVFPLEVGASWPYHPPGRGDEKAVEALEPVELPTGRVEAFRVVRLFQPPAPGFSLRSEQWFNALGLVRLRHQEISRSPQTDEQGSEIGEAVATHTVEMDLVRLVLADGTAVPGASWGAVKSTRRREPAAPDRQGR
jgi:hypothetical protein